MNLREVRPEKIGIFLNKDAYLRDLPTDCIRDLLER
jgi:hypothetical protein